MLSGKVEVHWTKKWFIKNVWVGAKKVQLWTISFYFKRYAQLDWMMSSVSTVCVSLLFSKCFWTHISKECISLLYWKCLSDICFHIVCHTTNSTMMSKDLFPLCVWLLFPQCVPLFPQKCVPDYLIHNKLSWCLPCSDWHFCYSAHHPNKSNVYIFL